MRPSGLLFHCVLVARQSGLEHRGHRVACMHVGLRTGRACIVDLQLGCTDCISCLASGHRVGTQARRYKHGWTFVKRRSTGARVLDYRLSLSFSHAPPRLSPGPLLLDHSLAVNVVMVLHLGTLRNTPSNSEQHDSWLMHWRRVSAAKHGARTAKVEPYAAATNVSFQASHLSPSLRLWVLSASC